MGSPSQNSQNGFKILEGQLRECYGRVVYSHKTHEKCSDILLSRLARIKFWQIVLSAVTTGGIVTTFFGSGQYGVGVAGIVSTLLLVLNAYTKDYDLGELAQKHKQAAIEIWMIRERYLSLLTDLNAGDIDLGQLTQRRDELIEDLHQTYKGCPTTTHQAYKRAQTALQRNQDMTFSEQEIDQLLPSELQRS